MRYSLTGAWLCHTGQVRRANEDACLAAGVLSEGSDALPKLFAVPDAPWVVAVSDGIGGHRGGAAASRAVVEKLAACDRLAPAGVRDALQQLNRELCDRGHADLAYEGMGATVAGLACGGKGLFAFSVGDSRVYRVEGARLIQITRDDSEAEELIEMGLLSVGDEIRPGYLHGLTQAIGGRAEHTEVEVHTHPLKLEERTRFLICSDGLTDMAGRAEIEAIMIRACAAEVVAEALFGMAMDAGGLDNITLAVLDVEPRRRLPRDSGQS